MQKWYLKKSEEMIILSENLITIITKLSLGNTVCQIVFGFHIYLLQ